MNYLSRLLIAAGVSVLAACDSNGNYSPIPAATMQKVSA